MTKNKLDAEQSELLGRKAELESEMEAIDARLCAIGNLKKPYVAAISSYSGGGHMAFATEKAARRKLDEYFGKKYFRNGLSYGAYLYRHNEDGTTTVLEVRPMSQPDFYPAELGV